MRYRTDDPHKGFDRWDAEQTAKLEKLPVCSECGEPIQTEKCYVFKGELICPDCLEWNHEENTEDFYE